jgi:hypothetical protein
MRAGLLIPLTGRCALVLMTLCCRMSGLRAAWPQPCMQGVLSGPFWRWRHWSWSVTEPLTAWEAYATAVILAVRFPGIAGERSAGPQVIPRVRPASWTMMVLALAAH